jgi:flagellar hook-associated protein FlgK
MSLSLALNNALSGLNVSQRSLAVLSNNVANANTEGYSRQVVEVSPQVAGRQGSGVRIEQIVRRIDSYLNRATQEQSTQVGQASTVSEYMSRIQVMMGQPGGTNSLDEYMNSFFNVLQSLAETPELSSFRSQAVNAGTILARELSTLAGSLEDLRYEADQNLQNELKVLNTEILRLQETNLSIYRAEAMGEPTASFLDQRDVLIKSISSYVDVKVNYQENGEAYVYTAAGLTLLESRASQFIYNGANSITTFTGDGTLGAITLDTLDERGQFINRPVEVVSSGVNKDITTVLRSGKLKGLLDVRDREIPDMLAQLDQIASRLRDEINAIHNKGSGVPAATSLTGDRAVGYDEGLEWSGTVRIAALRTDGSAPDARYGSSDGGFPALDLDLDALRSEYGDLLTVETIMNEINAHFAPRNNAVIENMQNVQLAALSNTVPDTGNTFNFDFELENISDSASNFWVTDLQVLDAGGGTIDTQNLAAANQVTLNAAGTFLTTAGSNVVTVNATGHGYSAGDVVYMNNVTGPVDGIPASEFNGRAFRITNVTANSYDIEVVTPAGTGTTVNMAGVTSLDADARQIAGSKSRTGDGGFTVDLSGNPTSAYYTVRANVMVEDDNGNLTATTVEYRVNGNATDTINERYEARAVGAGGTLETPTSQRALIKAQLVDADGNIALPGEEGFLQIVGQPVPGQPGETYTIVIDDLTSKELGRPNDPNPVAGSGWGMSHFFGLNNFFVSNEPSRTGDTVDGSALAMQVRQDILDNPNLISTGTLSRTPSTPVSGEYPDWSYERTAGANSVAQMMAKLGIDQLEFKAAGGLPDTVKSFNGYASEVLGYAAATAVTAESRYSDQLALLEGFESRVDSVSGVNIDEEMANTIIFQNAYSASSQVIRTVKELFDTLMASF